MELGISTFGELTPDAGGRTTDPATRMRHVIEEIELADQAGLDVFAVGEHHRPDFVISSPAVVLGAAAARTHHIRLASAVTVLSTDDPVRVFQDFATVDLLSGGRAEIWAGRGSFTESYPLFGYDLRDYDRLFEDKLALLLKVRESERVTWSGAGRPRIDGLGVYPRPVQQPLPVWIGVGGSVGSVIRAGRLGLPLIIAIIGGMPSRFAPLVEVYRESAAQAGHDPASLPVAINSLGFIADSSQAAVAAHRDPFIFMMNRIGRERGWAAMTTNQYEALRSPEGALLVGDPQQVIDKILYEHELFRNDRFVLQFSTGTASHDAVMRAIELFGGVVAPAVRKACGPARAVADNGALLRAGDA